MTSLVCAAPTLMLLPTTDGRQFPVRRIFCIGKNYSEHAVEMGSPVNTPPVFFMKPAEALTPPGDIPFPAGTTDLHYEGELVLALGENAQIIGIAAGCDLTKRDLQQTAKQKGGPWETAKAFDGAAVVGPVTLVQGDTDILAGRIESRVNGDVRQSAALGTMTLKPNAILKALGNHFSLLAGDIIFTGTPAGVGKLTPGDHVQVHISGCADLAFRLV